MKRILLITSLFFNAALFAAGTATVVRAHPYLTRGLEKESLIGMYFNTEWNSAKMGDFSVRFRCEKCSPSDISDIEVWKMPNEVAYSFCEKQAIKLEAKIVENVSGNVKIVQFSDFPTIQDDPICTINPERSRLSSDYVWITAKINPDIAVEAKIYTDIVESSISVSGDCEVVNGVAKAPHRVFPYYYKSGAYFRQDKVSGTSCAPLEDETSARLKSLNDIILINDLEPVYNAETKTISTTWDKRRNNTAGVKYVQGLRDAYHPEAMVRIGLTKGEPIAENSRYPLSLAIETEEGRSSLVNQIVSLMSELKVDGLDIDWEYPGMKSVWNAEHTKLVADFDSVETWKKDWHNYGLLMRDLSAAFFDHGWVLSMCTNLGYLMPSYTANIMPSEEVRQNYYAVLHVPDYIDSMAYGDKDINASPLVMQKAIKVITECGVKNRRIVVGQAIYSFEHGNRGWDWDVKRLMEQEPYKSDIFRRYDTDVVYVTETGASEATKNVFEGPSSYHAKIAWCRENDMGGAMSWGYYTDINWDGSVANTTLKTGLMSLGRHHAKSLPMIANLPVAPKKEGDIYLVETEQDWNWLATHQNVQAQLTEDITFSCDPMMIADWTGKLDGQNHTLTIPNDVWIVHEASSGLFKWIRGGTVKNLIINLEGRVITRASRWNDIMVEKGSNDSSCSNDVYVGVLAAEVRASSTLENVTINIKDCAEVQGIYRTGALAGNVFASTGVTLNIKNCRICNKGLVRNLNINTSETVLSLDANAKVDSLVGHVQHPFGANIYFTDVFAINPDKTISIVNSSDSIEKLEDAFIVEYYVENYVLNGHNKADFKLSIQIDDAGKPIVTAPEGFNGTIKILGAETLDGEWSENNPDAKFFKAELLIEDFR